jgi:hypothetical protein
MSWLKEYNAALSGPMAFDFFDPAKPALSGTAVIGVRDPKAILAILEQLPEKMKTMGLDKVYADLGMPMTMQFKRNVREVKGVAIHQLKMEVEVKSAPAPLQATLKGWASGTYDMAIVDNYLIYAVGGESIESMIDALKAKTHPGSKPLAAEAAFGPGGRIYIDYGVGQLMQKLMPADTPGMPPESQEAMKRMAAALADAPPICFAGFAEGGKYRIGMLIPAGLMSGFASAVPAQQSEDSETTDSEARIQKP